MADSAERMTLEQRRRAARTAQRVLLDMWEQATGGDLHDLPRSTHTRLNVAIKVALNIIEPTNDGAQLLAQ